jgi:4-hydroxybenzoate polyprenyltransferase
MPKITLLNYLSLVKFSHTVFALPFAIVGYFTALKMTDMHFEWPLFLKVILCMVFARSAAMSFNRFLDQDYDAKNPRTAIREIPAGIIQSKHALLFTIFSS